jgi:NTP pyrophosphatase (non-canonical NTP hydrolase)|tara:strand:- start:2103 stop:2459 length:357 start_codon:yes stop_codon:yes gene_type:complete
MEHRSDENYYQLNRYQEEAWETAIYPHQGDNLYYPALGLAGEAGEVCNKIKKIMRDQEGVLTPEQKHEIAQELGDVMWYIAALATELNSHLGCIASDNMDKLTSRKERGTIKGSGDKR